MERVKENRTLAVVLVIQGLMAFSVLLPRRAEVLKAGGRKRVKLHLERVFRLGYKLYIITLRQWMFTH